MRSEDREDLSKADENLQEANRLDRYDGVEIQYNNIVEGDLIVNEDTSRRGFLKEVLTGGAVVGVLAATAWFADNYDLEILGPNGHENGIGESEDAGESQEVAELDRPLNVSDYDHLVADDDLIGDIGDEYRSYSGEIGDLGGVLREAYQDSLYEDLTLGYHDDTWHVQMTNTADDLLLNFGFDSQDQYEESKRQARRVTQ